VSTNRRDFLRTSAVTGAGLLLGDGRLERIFAATSPPADVSLRIAPVLVELAPDRIISTIGYN
jgi:hypothetical protein